MTGVLARLGDLAYRRRGTVVLTWIAVMIAIIGVGSSLGPPKRRKRRQRWPQ